MYFYFPVQQIKKNSSSHLKKNNEMHGVTSLIEKGIQRKAKN